MHSHVGLQEQQLLAAPLIVRDPAERSFDEQEVIVLLHDFTFRDPHEIYTELRSGTRMSMDGEQRGMKMNGQQHGGRGQALGKHSTKMAESGQHGESNQSAMVHFNDMDYDAYLANDRTLADPEAVGVDPKGRIRLRVIKRPGDRWPGRSSWPKIKPWTDDAPWR